MDVRKLREEKNLSQQELADLTNIPKGRINGWEQRGTTPKKSDYDILVEFFSNYDRDSTSENVTKYTKYKPTSDDLIPFWDVDFIAGTSFDAIDLHKTKPDYYMDIPDFRGCTAFRAYSDSMEPLIRSGSILFGTKVDHWQEYLEYGQIYGVVCQDGRKFLKYIKKYRDDPFNFFLLESENKFYDEFEIPKKMIRSVWLIHGHLSKRI